MMDWELDIMPMNVISIWMNIHTDYPFLDVKIAIVLLIDQLSIIYAF